MTLQRDVEYRQLLERAAELVVVGATGAVDRDRYWPLVELVIQRFCQRSAWVRYYDWPVERVVALMRQELGTERSFNRFVDG